ncbi:MAG: hypothetical protein ACI4K9_07870 [Candidatus Fimenecus sp.]
MEKEKRNVLREQVLHAGTLVFTGLSVAAVFYYAIVLSKRFYSSDTADTIMWAQATLESGRILSPNYYYAAMLPFGGSLLMLPFVALFGLSYTAHACGMALFLGIFFVALYLFAKHLSFSPNFRLLFLAAFCGLMLCSSKFREMFCQHIIYYSLSILFLLLGFVLSENFCSALAAKQKNRSIAFGIGLFLFLLAVATDGMQIIGMVTVPLAAAFLAERFFFLREKFLSKQNLPVFLTVLLMAVATAVGLVVLRFLARDTYAVEYANAYTSYGDYPYLNQWVDKLENFLVSWYHLFEVYFSGGASLSDFSQIPVLLRFVAGTFCLSALPLTAILYRKIESVQIRRLFWVVTVVSGVTIFLWFFGIVSDAPWRLIPMISCCFLLLFAEIVYLFTWQSTKRFSVVSLCIVLFLLVDSVPFLIANKPVTTPCGRWNYIVEELTQRGIDIGYAGFWECNVLRVLTQDSLHIRCVTAVDMEGAVQLMDARYQQSALLSENTDTTEPCFLLLDGTPEALRESLDWSELAAYETECIYDADTDCTVFIFSRDIRFAFAKVDAVDEVPAASSAVDA